MTEIFSRHIETCPMTGCWMWTGAIDGHGYGRVLGKNRKNTQAHRISWEMNMGPIPSGMVLDHICRLPCCVNPAHLRIFTRRQNALENSFGMSALNAARKKCKNGHEYSFASSWAHPQRVCRECIAERDRSRIWSRGPNRGKKL